MAIVIDFLTLRLKDLHKRNVEGRGQERERCQNPTVNQDQAVKNEKGPDPAQGLDQGIVGEEDPQDPVQEIESLERGDPDLVKKARKIVNVPDLVQEIAGENAQDQDQRIVGEEDLPDPVQGTESLQSQVVNDTDVIHPPHQLLLQRVLRGNKSNEIQWSFLSLFLCKNCSNNLFIVSIPS